MMTKEVRAVVQLRERERGAYLCIKKLYGLYSTNLMCRENITSVQLLYTDMTFVYKLASDPLF
jgi:hypothetical protein